MNSTAPQLPITVLADILGVPTPPSSNVIWCNFGRNRADLRVRRDRNAAFVYRRNSVNGHVGNGQPYRLEENAVFYSDRDVIRYALKQGGNYVTDVRGARVFVLKVTLNDDDDSEIADDVGWLTLILEAARGSPYEDDVPAPEAPPPGAAHREPELPPNAADEAPTDTVVVDHPTVQQRITQFLQRVVPWPENPHDDGASGYVNIHWTILHSDGRPGMAGKPVRTVVEFLRLVSWILRRPKPGNIYFCLSLQQMCMRNIKGALKAMRSAENALAFKAVWLDLDVKEGGYATMAEAVAALVEFTRRYQLPVPTFVVISGSGLHVYWISKRALSVDEWRPYAEGLKAAALKFGLHCDVACTVNAAQILRVPGTLNFKTDPPKRVYLDPLQGEDLDFATDLKMLVDLVPPKFKGKERKIEESKGKPVEIPEAFRHHDLGRSLSEGITVDYPPINFDAVKAGCAWLREMHENGGANESQPLWYQAARCCVYLENGDKLIHELSEKYDGYDPEETEKKFEDAKRYSESKDLGWPLCKTIHETYECTHCKACPHLREGKSPLHLGLQGGQGLQGLRQDLRADVGVKLKDFYAFMPMHNYIFAPSREPWPATSVNARIPSVVVDIDEKGEEVTIKASTWIDRNQPVEMMTWAPGMPMIIADRLIAEGGWIERKGVSCFNLYRPPMIELGDASKAGQWVELVHKVYPTDADHIIKWFAWRVQHPEVKINHGLFMGGVPGIGKDTIIEGVKRAVGPWNFKEIAPKNIFDTFNPWRRAVILRVSEAKDMGEVNRFELFDAMLTLLAAPPDVLECNEKNIKQHYVLNCVGVVITSNHLTDGIFLPANDRRHYVAWSECRPADFEDDYWLKMWGWYDAGGDRHVAAYLTTLDISNFDPKASPPKTSAFWSIVNANRTSEEGELQDVLDQLGNPDAVTIGQLTDAAPFDPDPKRYSLRDWLKDRKNRKAVGHRLENCSYRAVNNPDASDGLWRIGGRRQVVYAKNSLSLAEQLEAAEAL
jgi:hypothetical protein